MTHVGVYVKKSLPLKQKLISQAMDVGIVFVIAVNAAVIGIAIDTPHHMAIWEVVEIVPW